MTVVNASDIMAFFTVRRNQCRNRDPPPVLVEESFVYVYNNSHNV